MAEDGGIVMSVSVEITASVRSWKMDEPGWYRYDWEASNGDESDELFNSAEEAADDFRERYS